MKMTCVRGCCHLEITGSQRNWCARYNGQAYRGWDGLGEAVGLRADVVKIRVRRGACLQERTRARAKPATDVHALAAAFCRRPPIAGLSE